MRKLFLDFDGTLLNSHRRLYTLFQELVPESRFTYEDYWKIKRARLNQRDLLRQHFEYSDEKIAVFKARWMAEVEAPARLASDTAFTGVTELLQRLVQHNQLFLVTARQHPDLVQAQIQRLDWLPYFTEILVTRQLEAKAEVIRASVACVATDMLVGDTGEDILAGKELGVITVAVASGPLGREVLEEYAPDHVLDSVLQLESVLA